jgi:hypothetical protein
MKDTFYFQHDYEPTADPKIQALLHKFGGIGYGLWWRIIEMLHSDEQHKIQHKKYIYLAIAGQMSTSVEQVQEFLNFCINDVELLVSDAEYFWSDRVNRNIEKRNDISLKRSFAGKKSAEQRNISSTNAEQVLTSVEQNPTKKRKGKEIKEKKENSIDISLTTLSLVEKIFLEKTAYNWTESYAKKEAEKFFNFYASKGWKVGKEKMKSLPHAIGGWISRNDKPETVNAPKEETEREYRLRMFNERNGLNER